MNSPRHGVDWTVRSLAGKYLLTEKERTLLRAINTHRMAVGRFEKYERRRWIDRIPEARAQMLKTLKNLYKAWDEVREENMERWPNG